MDPIDKNPQTDAPRRTAQFNWDDLRLCLLVARHGTVSSAADEIGVSHTTLLRKIGKLEERLGVILFKRANSGYSLNSYGERLVETAKDIEGQIVDTVTVLSGQDSEMRGRIVFSVPNLSGSALTGAVRGFLDENLDISIQVEVAQDASGLTAGNAHVALALTAEPPQGQIGTPVAQAAFAVYAKRSLLEQVDEGDLSWIGLSPSLQNIPVGRFDRRLSRRFERVHLFGSVELHCRAIRDGMGIGLLATGVGDGYPDLVRVSPALLDSRLTLWLFHRRELKGNARVTAFFRHMRSVLSRRKDLMEGRKPSQLPQILSVFSDVDMESSAAFD